VSPDEALFHAQLEDAPFQAGVDAAKWGLHGEVANIAWPHPVFWVQSDEDLVAFGKVFLRFTADGYPQAAPTACPWDMEKNCRLDPALWPKGPGNVIRIFNPGWNNGVALYVPCDRMAMLGHESWKSQFPNVWWQPSCTIVVYLDFVHSYLNRRKYAVT
jgi:hypothetical protein